MKISIITFTDKGELLGKKLLYNLNELGENTYLSSGRKIKLDNWIKENFYSNDALIFISAVGIAVRGISKYIVSKTTDCAVICIDEKGDFVIPILSGHIGGANRLAKKIANITKGTAIITTATDINNKFAFDDWASKNNFQILNTYNIKKISSAILDGKTIYLKSDFQIEGNLPQNVQICKSDEFFENTVVITFKNVGDTSSLYIIPKCITIGIGCKKNTNEKTIKDVIYKFCEKNNISINAIKKLVSIDLKKDERGIINFCENYNIEFQTYTSSELSKVKGNFSSSDFVKDITGVDNVCERSAVIEGNVILVKKYADSGVTLSAGIENYKINFSESI